MLQGVESDWLRWIDARGAVLPTGEEMARDAERRREDAERHLAEALAKIERLEGARS